MFQTFGTLTTQVGNDPPSDSDLDFEGSFPEGEVEFPNANSIIVKYDDTTHVMVDEVIMSDELPVDINFEMVGLQGQAVFQKP